MRPAATNCTDPHACGNRRQCVADHYDRRQYTGLRFRIPQIGNRRFDELRHQQEGGEPDHAEGGSRYHGQRTVQRWWSRLGRQDRGFFAQWGPLAASARRTLSLSGRGRNLRTADMNARSRGLESAAVSRAAVSRGGP